MPNDVEDLFASLAADAGRVMLPPSAAVRRRADRRLLVRSVTGLAAVVVLVAGIAAGAGLLWAEPDRAPVAPAAATLPSRGPAIPPEAFLQAADLSPVAAASDDRISMLPMCDVAWGYKHWVMLTGAAAVSDGGRAVAEEIYVYQRDGAERFMTDFRSVVTTCDDWMDGARFRVDGPLGLEADSVLVALEGGPAPAAYLAAVRHRDTVALMQFTGTAAAPMTRAEAVDLTRAAATRMAAWRG
jgi:hypothetical protein